MQPISCDLHDYLEIACLYGYDLRLQFLNGSVVEGQAVTTETAPGRVEHLVLLTGSARAAVPMHEIDSVTALTANGFFSILRFSYSPGQGCSGLNASSTFPGGWPNMP